MTQPNLDQKRSEVEARLANLHADPDPGVSDLMRKADQAVRKFRDEADALEAELNQIDAQIGVRERDRRASVEASREEREAALRHAVMQRHEQKLAHLEKAEAHIRGFVAEVNAAGAEHTGLREAARALAQSLAADSNAKVRGFDLNELVARIAGGVIGIMRTLRIPGAHAVNQARFGAIELLGGDIFHEREAWADRESRAVGPAIKELLEKGQR